jgi:hypothetical protein
MGSAHSEVSVYLIRPPASAAALLENEILVQRKWDIARHAIGSASAAPFPNESSGEAGSAGDSVTGQVERLRAILSGWRRPLAEARSDEVYVASVSSPRSGFVAVVGVDGELRLVVGLSGHLSTDLESQVVACRLGSGVGVKVKSQESEAALRQLYEWADRESASAFAGLGVSSALRRRRLVNRIDAAIESAPPHSRSRRLVTAAKARRVAAAQHSAAIEAELELLALAALPDDEWLAAVAKLEPTRAASDEAPRSKRGLEIHALLLLCSGTSRRPKCQTAESAV